MSTKSDIDKVKVKPDAVKSVLDTVLMLFNTKTCKVKYRELDVNGNSVGEENKIWKDVVDDPDTPEDETSTEFTDLIATIDAGNDFETTIMNEFKKKK